MKLCKNCPDESGCRGINRCAIELNKLFHPNDAAPPGTELTPDELGDYVSDLGGHDRPEYQREANRQWARSVHALLNEGGVLASPNLQQAWKRRGDKFVRTF